MSQKIQVNATPNELSMPTLFFSQGDVGRVFQIEIVSSDGYSIPSGATVKINATKPSGFGFSVSGTVTNNTVDFTTTEEMTDESGRFLAELEITSGNVVIGSANFYMCSEANPHPEGTIDGSAESIVPQLTLLVERVENAAAAVLDTTTEVTTLPAGSQATYSFDEETNTATFGIPQGEAGAGAAGVVASAYSASKTYAVGDYAIHNSNLYRCTTAIATAESFTASHWTQVVLADDVTDLKSDINDIEDINQQNILNGITFEMGGVYEGEEVARSNRIRSEYIDLSNVHYINFSALDGYKYFVSFFSDIGEWASNQYGTLYYGFENWFTEEKTAIIIPSIKYMRVVIADASDSSNIKPTDAKKIVALADYKLLSENVDNQNFNGTIGAWMSNEEYEIGGLVWGGCIPDASNSSIINAGSARICSNYIPIPDINGTIKIKADSGYKMAYYIQDANFNRVTQGYWYTEKSIPIQNNYKYLILGLATSSDTVITPSEKTNAHLYFVPTLIAEVIPPYFEADIADAIETSRNNIFSTGIDGDSFIFITDVHWQSNQKHSPTLVKQITGNTNVDKIICGGDLIGGGAKASMIELMSDCVDSFKNAGRFYALLGNHDTNKIGAGSSDDYFTKANAYALMQKESDFVMTYGQPCYFYFDNPTTKTRYVCLDTGEEGTALDATQKAWLSTALNSMPTGFHALIFAHIIYEPTTNWHVGLSPSELYRTAFMNEVCTYLDTFNEGNQPEKKVEAIFGGHVHIDANFTTNGGIPIVLTDCDTRQTFTETSTGSGVANHAEGTINEQCFDITTIDYANKTIKCVRVGRGSNRTITY